MDEPIEQDKVKTDGRTARTFSYEYGDAGDQAYTTLNFTLRIDIPDELKGYVVLLERALADVREELAKHD